MAYVKAAERHEQIVVAAIRVLSAGLRVAQEVAQALSVEAG
ncbi:hypothetical protein [Mycolicibacterium lutetiense]